MTTVEGLKSPPGPFLRDYSLLNSHDIEETKALQARKKFSRTSTFKIFLILSTLLAFTEPVLIGAPHKGIAFQLQIIILALSSITFIADIVFTARFYDTSEEKLSRWQLALAVAQGEALLDGLCLTFGWCFIFFYPGLAALRCFRVFRLLWFYELFPDYKQVDFNPAHAFFSLRKASQLCLRYMTGIFHELFTQKSKGGMVLITIYLYLAYLFAVVFWTEAGDVQSIQELTQECYYLNSCFITMIRLSFYDGNGFNFLQTLALDGRVGQTFLAFVYLILTGMILLNGVIGIFGTAFLGAVDENDDPITSPEEEQSKNNIASPAAAITNTRSFFGRNKAATIHPGSKDKEFSVNSLPEEKNELILLMKEMREEIAELNTTVSDLKKKIRK